jgi:hypothetical protein
MAAATPKTPLKLTEEVSELIKEKIKVRMAREINPSNKAR